MSAIGPKRRFAAVQRFVRNRGLSGSPWSALKRSIRTHNVTWLRYFDAWRR
jgi:hypothetical protein